MNTEIRPICEIAKDIKKSWKNPYFGAVPYIEAMSNMTSIHDNYGLDSAKSILLYFLLNAKQWHGRQANAIKSEIRNLCDLKT